MYIFFKETLMKNFLYNNSDILVALGVIAAAAAIIAWRIQILMSYTA